MPGNGRGRGIGRGSIKSGIGRGRGMNKPSWMEPIVDGNEKEEENQNNQNHVEKEEQQQQEEEEDILMKQLEQKDDEQLQKLFSNNHNNDENDEEDDDNIFSSFFGSNNNKESDAQLRRMKRKERLKQLAASSSENDDMTPIIDDDVDKKGSKKRQKILDMDENIIIHTNVQNDESNNSNGEIIENQSNSNHNNDDDNDSFDMFASTSPLSTTSPAALKDNNIMTRTSQRADDNDTENYNDSEGYYKGTIGEVITFPFTKDDSLMKEDHIAFKVMGIVGKGVFSSVLKCNMIPNQIHTNNQQENEGETIIVAMKLIRSNDVMTKAAEKEVRILRMLQGHNSKNGKADTNNHFIVRMLELDDFNHDESNQHNGAGTTNKNSIDTSSNFDNMFFKQRPILEYRNHTVLLFEYMPNNLRQVLSKFGKNVGINLASVKSYARQLLLALHHLSSHGVIHADIKLDNILVTSNWSTIKLCDFGSAFLESDEEYINHIPTPYLVSRFYRAPEIILGLKYDKMIDLWSVAVSLAELFTGNILFPGRTNNDMIKCFMESIGPISNKMIKRHISAFTKIGSQPHFESHAGGGGNFDFRMQDFDKVTGKPIIRILNTGQDHKVMVSSKQISQVMLKSRSGSDNRGDVIKFADFLSRCLTLDPAKRMSIHDALKHGLFEG